MENYSETNASFSSTLTSLLDTVSVPCVIPPQIFSFWTHELTYKFILRVRATHESLLKSSQQFKYYTAQNTDSVCLCL